MGKDIIARAKNGTGKTGSFVIPILEKVNFTQKYVQALILVPTRELALQTSATIREIGKYLNVQCMITTGGTNLKDDIYRLYNPVQVLVGTPGRVFDLANKGALDLSKCSILVLDEADKLLSQDFQKVLENILSFLPLKRQIMLFSATFPLNVKSFKDKYLKNAILKNLMEELTLLGITQYYTYLEEKLKLHCLHTLFQKSRNFFSGFKIFFFRPSFQGIRLNLILCQMRHMHIIKNNESAEIRMLKQIFSNLILPCHTQISACCVIERQLRIHPRLQQILTAVIQAAVAPRTRYDNPYRKIMIKPVQSFNDVPVCEIKFTGADRLFILGRSRFAENVDHTVKIKKHVYDRIPMFPVMTDDSSDPKQIPLPFQIRSVFH